MNEPSRIPIVRYEPANPRGEPMAPRGSVAVYLAADGSRQLLAVRDIAAKGEHDATLLRGTDVADDDGHRVTVTYGGQVLAADVPVPRDGRAVRLVLPFTGGELDGESLLLEASDAPGAVAAVAVRHDPPLTAVEQAALTLLPRDVLSANLGVALPGGIVGTNDEERRRQEEENRRAAEEARNERAAAQAEAQADAAEARAEARREAGGRDWGSRIEIHMLDSTVKTLSSVQAATAMLEIRRELLRDRQVHG